MTARTMDVIVIGGGPAGLSAALMLGRARRRVLVVDESRPRNSASQALCGLLSRIAPLELLEIARQQLRSYDSVEWLQDRVERAQRTDERFQLETRGGRHLTARKIVVATGVMDVLPPVKDLPELYGDASRDVQQVAVAVGEGSEAAIALNAELIKEDFA